jgi:hypothetical protein
MPLTRSVYVCECALGVHVCVPQRPCHPVSLPPHTRTAPHTLFPMEGSPGCHPLLSQSGREGTASAHSWHLRLPGTHLIPGASSRLVRPVQLICRCCGTEGWHSGWKDLGTQAKNLTASHPPT